MFVITITHRPEFREKLLEYAEKHKNKVRPYVLKVLNEDPANKATNETMNDSFAQCNSNANFIVKDDTADKKPNKKRYTFFISFY